MSGQGLNIEIPKKPQFDVLGLPNLATPDEQTVRKSYRKLFIMIHPDALINRPYAKNLPFKATDVLLAATFFLRPADGELRRLRQRYGVTRGESADYHHHWFPERFQAGNPSFEQVLIGVARGPLNQRGTVRKRTQAPQEVQPQLGPRDNRQLNHREVWVGWALASVDALSGHGFPFDVQHKPGMDHRVTVIASFDARGRFLLRTTPYNMENLYKYYVDQEEAQELKASSRWFQPSSNAIQFEGILLAPQFRGMNKAAFRTEVCRYTHRPAAERFRRKGVPNPDPEGLESRFKNPYE